MSGSDAVMLRFACFGRTQAEAGGPSKARVVLRAPERAGTPPPDHHEGRRADAEPPTLSQQRSQLLQPTGTDANLRYKGRVGQCSVH